MPTLFNEEVIHHESNLEKDFIYILKFDPGVLMPTLKHLPSLKAQPLKIPYSLDGKEKFYVPDFYVKYKNGSQVIFEVKYEDYLKKHKKELTPKFSAARAYAKKHGLKFETVTDAQIRTGYKTSITFLDQFRTDIVDLKLTQRILDGLAEKKKCSGNELLSSIAHDEQDYNFLIRPFWVLVFNQRICCDLFESVTLDSLFWLSSTRKQKFLSFPYKSKSTK